MTMAQRLMYDLRVVIARPLLWVLWHVWQIGDDAERLSDRVFEWVDRDTPSPPSPM